jgi:formate dehydrogenase subunit beta
MEAMIDSRMMMPDFLAALFDKLDVAGVAAMSKLPSGEKAAFTLFTGKDGVKECVPFFPSMPANAARAVSKLTREEVPSKTVAVFLRPCELRAFTELVKINQAAADNLLIISYDCPGVVPFQEIHLSDETKLNEYRDAASAGKNCEGIRAVCAACTRFTPKGADIAISVIGRNPDQPLVLSFPSEKGMAAAKQLELDLSKTANAAPGLETLARERGQAEASLTAGVKASFCGTEGLMNVFDRCISCHACSYVCPICYCKNCYFDSQTFEYFPESYFSRMAAKGALRMPVDRILFHLGRLSHMGLSCVACGMCEDVCPVNIPVSQIFKTAGKNVQALFAYIPGENPDEPLPLLTYAERELEAFED